MSTTTPTMEATEFLGRFAAAWADNDGSALGRFFTADGSLLNPFGERADGQTAIADMYTDYFAGLLAGTTSTITGVTSRSAGAGALFVDAEQAINGADSRPIMVVHLAALLTQEGGEWRFAHSRPYLPASPVQS